MLLFLSISLISYSQNSDSFLFKVPTDVTLRNVYGGTFNSSNITNQGKPIIIIFWKYCCSSNITMLSNINEMYSDWQKETGVVIYAVSIDDPRNSLRIAPLVNSNQWEFNVLLDVNSDFKRAMNVLAVPHVFIINGKNEIVWQKSTYTPSEEDEIFKILKSLK
jgi:cytochrome c biogenesis protein CcmG, thiol:disulfide interchange protein DsbE